jgi:hypothetical protein
MSSPRERQMNPEEKEEASEGVEAEVLEEATLTDPSEEEEDSKEDHSINLVEEDFLETEIEIEEIDQKSLAQKNNLEDLFPNLASQANLSEELELAQSEREMKLVLLLPKEENLEKDPSLKRED